MSFRGDLNKRHITIYAVSHWISIIVALGVAENSKGL